MASKMSAETFHLPACTSHLRRLWQFGWSHATELHQFRVLATFISFVFATLLEFALSCCIVALLHIHEVSFGLIRYLFSRFSAALILLIVIVVGLYL